MSNVERIEKFYTDMVTVMGSCNWSKVSSEIGKLKQWLVKHQDETIPDASKSKIIAILERYHRAAGNYADIRSSVADLFSDYLQMPEGKLVSAKDKAKVLKWLQSMSATEDNDDDSSRGGGDSVSSRWTVESIDDSKKTCSLLSTIDEELWKEDLTIQNSALFAEIKKRFEGAVAIEGGVGSQCILEIDDKGDIKLVSS